MSRRGIDVLASRRPAHGKQTITVRRFNFDAVSFLAGAAGKTVRPLERNKARNRARQASRQIVIEIAHELDLFFPHSFRRPLIHETKQIAGHSPHLNFLSTLGDTVPTMVPINVFKRFVA